MTLGTRHRSPFKIVLPPMSRSPGTRRQLKPAKATERIDGIVAAIMAIGPGRPGGAPARVLAALCLKGSGFLPAESRRRRNPNGARYRPG
jgi:hypothetical protein